MDCRVRAGLECQAALIQAEIDLLGVSIDEHELATEHELSTIFLAKLISAFVFASFCPVYIRSSSGNIR